MKIFTAHRPPQASQEEAVFIKEGFSWPAFFFPVIWLVLKRLWFSLIIYLLALNLLLGMEGNERRRRALARRGFIEEGPFVGEDLQEAELKYFQHDERVR